VFTKTGSTFSIFTVNYDSSYLFNEFVCNFGFLWHEWTSLKLSFHSSFKNLRVPKKPKLHKNELNTTYSYFCSLKVVKGSKSLKIFKISLTFRFDKLSTLSKSVHTGENSQILTVSNKKNCYLLQWLIDYVR
jgi:hypothetical protein